MIIHSKKICESNGKLGFYCPGCDSLHFISVNPNQHPFWYFNNNYEMPTFNPSILVTFTVKVCHSFIKEGRIDYLSDCSHHLSGKNVKLPDLPQWVLDGNFINPNYYPE